ncbi:MAG: hypothetical protein P4L74_01365 [Candidatus Doudnabacteria bacterium]|nr:hypothetical protein [Candidatus Doudnabacteria bacterium]
MENNTINQPVIPDSQLAPAKPNNGGSIYFPPNPKRQAGEIIVGILLFCLGFYVLYLGFVMGSKTTPQYNQAAYGSCIVNGGSDSKCLSELHQTSIPSAPLIILAIIIILIAITLFNVAWARSQGPMSYSIASNLRGGPMLLLAVGVQYIWKQIFK